MPRKLYQGKELLMLQADAQAARPLRVPEATDLKTRIRVSGVPLGVPIPDLRLVKWKFGKRVLVLHPCGPGRRRSIELQKVASKSLIVDASLLATCQFPATLTDTIGTIHKPATW